MILVDSITIREFRGIRDLTLNFKGKNFAICGPNGTGKSGVVDAIEFGLTGNVSRLSGEGKGDISLKVHGPHVDRRNDPEKAYIKIIVTIPSLGKTASIERTLRAPASARVTPNDPAILAVINQVEQHPEIVLSRRELIRYVLATPGKRAEEVQALLHLDQVEQVRSVLQKIANAADRELKPLEGAVGQARDSLLRALGITDLTKDGTLAVANAQRTVLGLQPLADFTETSSFKDGLAAPGPARAQRIPKAQALADIRATRQELARMSEAENVVSAGAIVVELTALATDPALSAAVTRESFYSTAMRLIDQEACPLCDKPWAIDELKKHVQAKIDHFKELSRRRQAIEAKLAPLIAAVRKIQPMLTTLSGYAALTSPPVVFDAVKDHRSTSALAVQRATAFIPLDETISAVADLTTIPPAVLEAITALEKSVTALPDPTKEDASREWLTIAQERLEVWRESMRKKKAAKELQQKTRSISETYASTSDNVLTGIYTAVEKDFSSLYGFINRDDESSFKAQLVPSMGKLGFDVDFYGRGFFPPGAYHSEGHQDGMGLCLFLALMRHIQGGGFTFAVLDDVLMSVDSGHRREVCALLKKEFPHTQFIMTTHDQVWLRHMQTEMLISGRSSIRFRGWSVDQGPHEWDDRSVWGEIADYLKKNDVRSAAALLRHFLEYSSTELCHRLSAPVAFREDGRHQLGELLPAAIGRMKKLFGSAKDAASSWDQRDIVKLIEERSMAFGQLVAKSNVEQWQVNVAVHYNSWENLTKQDFEPVVMAFRELLVGFTCPACGEYLRATLDRETVEALRCGCGKMNFNQMKKGT